MHTPPRCVLTDEFFRVEGSDGSIFVMGDAATIHTSLASEHVDELFESADTDKDGLLTVGQLQKLLHDAEKEFPHLAKHARFLDGKQNRCAFCCVHLGGEVVAAGWRPGVLVACWPFAPCSCFLLLIGAVARAFSAMHACSSFILLLRLPKQLSAGCHHNERHGAKTALSECMLLRQQHSVDQRRHRPVCCLPQWMC